MAEPKPAVLPPLPPRGRSTEELIELAAWAETYARECAERARADALEQAAKICDTVATRVPDGAISPYDAAKYVVAKDCAAAIRALIPAKDAE